MKTKHIFWLLPIAYLAWVVACAAETAPITARVVGFQVSGDEMRFFFKVANRTQRHLFLFGNEHNNSGSFADLDAGFEVPPGSIRLSYLSGSIEVVLPGGSPRLPPIPYSKEPLGHVSTYYLLSHGREISPGDTRPSGSSEDVDVSVYEQSLRDVTLAKVGRPCKLALVFNVPVYALNESGTKFTEVFRFATPSVVVEVNAKGQITVVDPAAPTKRAKAPGPIEIP